MSILQIKDVYKTDWHQTGADQGEAFVSPLQIRDEHMTPLHPGFVSDLINLWNLKRALVD